MIALISLILFVVIANGITTIPFSIGLLTVTAVIFRKSWLFFLALGLGLFLDSVAMRSLGYSSLLFVSFIFILFLYERKFETRTAIFVFISSFVGGVIYLKILGYPQILFQSLINSLVVILLFKILNSKVKQKIRSHD